MVNLSVIIINFSTPDMTLECVRSLQKYLNSAIFELIIVDNNSQDNSILQFKQELKDIKIIALEKNLGYGGAVNVGVENSTGKFIVLLNSDIIIKTDFFFPLRDFYKQNNAGIIGIKLINSKNELQPSFSYLPSPWTPLLVNISIFRKINSLHTSRYAMIKKEGFNTGAVGWVTGAFMFIERNHFLQIGGFDDHYFMFYEDADICMQSYKSGRLNFYLAEHYAIHKHQASVNKIVKKDYNPVKVWEKQSALYFIRKNFPRHYPLLKFLFVILYMYRTTIYSMKYFLFFFSKKQNEYRIKRNTAFKILFSILSANYRSQTPASISG